MITGTVTTDGVPMVSLAVAGKTWPAIIDTGFNGDLELPEALRSFVKPRFLAATEWLLAGDQRIIEDTLKSNPNLKRLRSPSKPHLSLTTPFSSGRA